MPSKSHAKTALRAFFKISAIWKLDEREELKILGQDDPEVLQNWRKGNGPSLSRDTLERISYVLGIFKAINILIPSRDRASEWMRSPNKAHLFGGNAALERMTAGNVSDLYVVRQNLDAELMGEDSTPSGRLFGTLRGKIVIASDFDALPDDILDAMEGG